MKTNSVKKLNLTPLEDIFKTTEEREESKREKVLEIRLDELHTFENHPFRVRDDDEMKEMVESIEKFGIVNPGIARPHKDGGYELIVGHRRKRACELAGKETMPVIVRELDDDEAILIMVDSNLMHRETLMFSERAYAYKMRVEAIKRQAGRPPKENGSQNGINTLGKKSYEIVGEQAGESKNKIYRYIRLTELNNELMEMVDEKKIAFSPAVELSFLKKDEQELLIYEIEKEEATPSLSQAQRMKKHSQDGTLTAALIEEIMREVKKEEIKVTLTGERIKKFFPSFVTPQEMEDTIINLLESWYKLKQQQHNQ